MITITNTKTGSTMTLERCTLRDLHGNLVKYQDQYNVQQNGKDMGCTVPTAKAQEIVANARKTDGMTVEGDL